MPVLAPDTYYTSVHAIDLDALAARGKDTLLIDLDQTLLPRDTNVVPPELLAWSADLAQRGFKVVLVSNNWHERVGRVASELGFQLVPKALKPLPFAFRRALNLVGSTPAQAVIIGDQLFTDVLGGKLSGIETLLVVPLSMTDLPHTLALRKLEKVILKDRQPVG